MSGFAQVLTREGMEGTEEVLLDVQSDDFDASINFSSDFVSAGTDMDASALLDIVLSFSQMGEAMNADARLDFDFRLVEGNIYMLMNDVVIEMSEPNPMVGMIQGALAQLQEQWISVDFEEIASVTGDPSLNSGSPFSSQAIEESENFILDMSQVVADNYLFAAMGDAYEKDGVTAYDIEFNAEGIQTIARTFYEHPYVVSAMQTDASFDQDDIDQMIESIPAALETVALDGHLLVHAEDRVALVIESLTLPEETTVLTAHISPREVQVRMYADDTQETLLWSVDDVSNGVEMQIYNQDQVLASAVMSVDSSVSDNRVAYKFLIDGAVQMSVLDPFVPEDSTIDFSLIWDEQSQRASDNQIAVPEDAQSIMDVFGGMMGPAMSNEGPMTDPMLEAEMME